MRRLKRLFFEERKPILRYLVGESLTLRCWPIIKLTGGQALVKCLEAEGVGVIFGIPGINILEAYDALYDSSIRHVLAKHEQSAGYMADAYARVTGKPGVCLVTAGPGLTNALTALATAYCDSIPVLVLAGEIRSDLIGRDKGVLHEIDQMSIVKSVTKSSYTVRDVEQIPQIMHQAFVDLCSGRPRPVYVGLPEDILEQTTDFPGYNQAVPPRRLQGDESSLREAARLLSGSARPVILSGGGVTSADAFRELVKVAELLSAPVISTVMGHGAIPGDHPLFVGLSRRPRIIEEALEEADAMLAVGTRFSSLSTKGWALKIPEHLVHIDIDPEMIGRNYPVKIGVTADAKAALTQMLTILQQSPQPSRKAWLKRVEDLKAQAWNELRNFPEAQLVMELRDALDRDAIITADTTILSYWMQRIFPIYQPRTFLYPFGYVSMGFALPAAISSKITFPKRQVVAVCGDGGFMMTCQDLATAAENNVNIVILLINSGSYGILKRIQEQEYGGRHIGVDLHNPDFVKLAESFGVRAVRIESQNHLMPRLREALMSDRPSLIEIPTGFNPPPR